MGLFSRKDWNVIGVIFEKTDLYQVNGNRVQGGQAEKTRDATKGFTRTLLWAVFDQKGACLESGEGAGTKQIPVETLKKLQKVLLTNRTVLEVLKALETKQTEKMAKPLAWMGYPQKEVKPDYEEG